MFLFYFGRFAYLVENDSLRGTIGVNGRAFGGCRIDV